ncbi:phage portal protein [Photobacterium halotolerans]|uniref:Phage portal protein n=1 Tax=Photobacterium halotolerans TaxID=265726 RepID=A0A0F5VGU1_9GAMM|nr:phage portal protein [Photobacterium halotolerans]KKD01396.1 phage portal protein [Photobacterium halotolerans]
MTEALITTAANDEHLPETLASSYSIGSDIEVVDSNSWLTEYTDLFYNDGEDYWEPPINPEGLAQLAHANAYHGSMLIARGNYVAGRFKSGGNIRRRHMAQFCRDYFQFGHGALLKLRNRAGGVMGYYPLPAMFMRKRKNGDFWLLEREDQKRPYKAKDVIWLPQYDPKQQVYGLPDYVGGMQSSLLNKDATLFRRRYYKNGAHMGFIFYATDPNLSPEDEKMMKSKIASSKGVGNFRSMFVNIPNGKEKGIQLIPVGDIATKDEFERIKNITAQDVLVSHRFPPGKGGIVPTNAAGFGDIEKVSREYARDEVIPVCELIMDEVNNDPEIAPYRDLHLRFDMALPGDGVPTV